PGAGREGEMGWEGGRKEVKADAPLAEARRHQEAVERSIAAMLERLEPWSGANEVRGETRALLQEQERVGERTEEMNRNGAGLDRSRLDPQQQAELDRVAGRQERLAGQANQLLDKIDRVAQDKARAAKEKADQATVLEKKADAAEKAAKSDPDERSRAAKEAEARQQRGEAQQLKDQSAALEKEAKALRDAHTAGRTGLQKQDAG